MDIERLKQIHIDGFVKGDHIVVQEKIDGANFSIRYDAENDIIAAFSRKNPLSFENNLRGAWQWAQKLDKYLVKNVLGENLILFGEWLVSHTIVYPEDKYQNAYFFDVYDLNTGSYLPQNEVMDIINRLELNYVPVFYDGEFQSWEHIQQFVGRTDLGGESGEGVVVKNMTRLPFYTKIVGERFSEKKHTKKVKLDKMAEIERLQEIVKTVVTEARVVKLVHKMVDDGIIPENWDEHDMGTIAKNIGKAVYYDCLKEEPEVVDEVGEHFGKVSQRLAMQIVRQKIIQ